MKDLIQTLVARTLGVEPVMQPRIGSLYEPADSAGWDRSPLQDVVEEVVVRPGITPDAGFPASRPSFSKSVSRDRAAAGSASAMQPSASLAVGTQDLPGAALAKASGVTPDTPASMTPTAAMGPSSMPAVGRPSTVRSGLETPASALVGRFSDSIDAVVRGGPSVEVSSVEPRILAKRVTTAEPSSPEPAPASAATSPGTPASNPPRGMAETAVRTTSVAPAPEQPIRHEPPGHPRPVPPGSEREQPVIQVTIGRVEVGAIAPPQAAAPPARRRPFPSLEEYLEHTSEARA